MLQALEAYRSRELSEVSAEKHVSALAQLANRKQFKALKEALRQRYSGEVS
jgi:hypothetical protein